MLDSDERPNAVGAANLVALSPQYWDGTKRLGLAISKGFGYVDEAAWDVYLFYSPQATWTSAGPPAAEKWLVQAAGAVISAPGMLPASGNQNVLAPALRDKVVVVGSQASFETILASVTHDFVARYPIR